MNKKLFKTITKKIIIVLLCFSAVIAASVTLFLLFWQQMPKEISYKEANFSHTVGAVAISDMTDGKKTKKRDGFIVLLNNDGTSKTIATSAIDSPAILWNTDGLYFVDAKFDYFLAQKATRGSQLSIAKKRLHKLAFLKIISMKLLAFLIAVLLAVVKINSNSIVLHLANRKIQILCNHVYMMYLALARVARTPLAPVTMEPIVLMEQMDL